MSFCTTGPNTDQSTPPFAPSGHGPAAQREVPRIAADCTLGGECSPIGHEHDAIDSLYRMRFASYIRSGATTCGRLDAAPEQIRTRTLAVRAFDIHGSMLSWELVEGRELEAVIGRLLADPKAQYLRVHYAALDRYAAWVERN